MTYSSTTPNHPLPPAITTRTPLPTASRHARLPESLFPYVSTYLTLLYPDVYHLSAPCLRPTQSSLTTARTLSGERSRSGGGQTRTQIVPPLTEIPCLSVSPAGKFVDGLATLVTPGQEHPLRILYMPLPSLFALPPLSSRTRSELHSPPTREATLTRDHLHIYDPRTIHSRYTVHASRYSCSGREYLLSSTLTPPSPVATSPLYASRLHRALPSRTLKGIKKKVGYGLSWQLFCKRNTTQSYNMS